MTPNLAQIDAAIEELKNTKKIPLVKKCGEIADYAIVDSDDYDFLNQWKWGLQGQKYAHRAEKSGRYGKTKMIFMHRIVNKTPDGYLTDHINGNKLDNRKSNLRSCTKSGNASNMSKKPNFTSKYKGVSWNKEDKLWIAQTHHNLKKVYIGCFKSEEAAALAYNETAKKLHGEFAVLNEVSK